MAVAWPPLEATAADDAQAAVASVPLPRDADAGLSQSLLGGDAAVAGVRLQAQSVATWPDGRPRRLLVRAIGDDLPACLEGVPEAVTHGADNAGWSFSYRLVAASADEVPWKTALRDVPLEETEYEMYQLDLVHEGQTLGLRLGLRRQGRLYWWQYVRADFVQRGPVFDVLRVGGPIYNEESTLQSDVHLVLYANGVIEAQAHFVNHQREGEATATHGIPVLAFDAPGAGAVDESLDGAQTRFGLGAVALDLGAAASYGSPKHPGRLSAEEGVIVWQPWADQQVWGELLVDDTDIPEHRIDRGIGEGQKLLSGQRAEADKFWVTRVGDEHIPRGLARSVPFILSLGPVPPAVRRYQAPSWWHGYSGALPTGGCLPVSWWALPHTLELGREQFATPHPRGGFPFEVGRSAQGNDGTLAAAMLLLGHAGDDEGLCRQALQPAYWWADVAIDHVNFTTHELPKYSWQWIVQPYHRWLELVHAYWETGDPYLLETARFTADAFYRFFWTNRPHRFVGRDALAVADLLALWESTGEAVYLQRSREVLAEARCSYDQHDAYWPGHQSGAGPNGVARQPSWDYIPMLLGRLHVQLLWCGEGRLEGTEVEEIHGFLRFVVELVLARGGDG